MRSHGVFHVESHTGTSVGGGRVGIGGGVGGGRGAECGGRGGGSILESRGLDESRASKLGGITGDEIGNVRYSG